MLINYKYMLHLSGGLVKFVYAQTGQTNNSETGQAKRGISNAPQKRGARADFRRRERKGHHSGCLGQVSAFGHNQAHTWKGWCKMIDVSSYMESQIHEGDCLKLMPEIPDESIDMVLCDLPYGTTQNAWDSVIPLDVLWSEYERIIKPNGVICLTAQGVFTAKLIISNTRLFKYKLVWEKSKPTNFLNAKKQPLRKHEDICIFYKKPPTYNPQFSAGEAYSKGVRKAQHTGSYGEFAPVLVASEGRRYPTDVIYFKTAESEGQVFQPTQKPVALGRYLIRTFTNLDEIVLDNAFGSGSFLVAAKAEGRRFIGIEKNEDVEQFRRDPVDLIEIATQRLSCVDPATELASVA